MIWGYVTVFPTSVSINHEVFGAFALFSLVPMAWLRLRYGPGLWDDAGPKNSYTVLLSLNWT